MPENLPKTIQDEHDQLPSEEGSFQIEFPWTASFDSTKSSLGPEAECVLVGAIDYEDFAAPAPVAAEESDEYPARIYDSFRPLRLELPDGRSLALGQALREPGFDQAQISEARGEIFEAAKLAAGNPAAAHNSVQSLRASWARAAAPTAKPRKP